MKEKYFALRLYLIRYSCTHKGLGSSKNDVTQFVACFLPPLFKSVRKLVFPVCISSHKTIDPIAMSCRHEQLNNKEGKSVNAIMQRTNDGLYIRCRKTRNLQEVQKNANYRFDGLRFFVFLWLHKTLFSQELIFTRTCKVYLFPVPICLVFYNKK